MELVLPLFAGLGETALATAATVGAETLTGWATTVIPAGMEAAAGASSWLTTLQGGLTAGQLLATGMSGFAGFSEAQQAAGMAEVQSQAERVASEERALRIRQEHVRRVGSARVAIAGSGLDLSSGAAVEADLANQANFEIGIEANNARLRDTMGRARAMQLRTRGLADLIGTGARMAQIGAGTGIDIARRG